MRTGQREWLVRCEHGRRVEWRGGYWLHMDADVSRCGGERDLFAEFGPPQKRSEVA